MTLSTAESCTGGRIAAAITAHSGASNYFRGGLVAYQNDVKEEMLGVPHEMIATYGVVSRQVAEQMVKGACRLFHSDYALASTGYAEAWEGHDVEIWVAWGSEHDVHSICLTEDFGRVKNVELATQCVLDEFNKYLKMLSSPFTADQVNWA
ncbi:MAG: CinA family protein [Bacteroidaceae bacterium]|jgi:nicotinamide-nucleotide amidase|nr:CinA family protein [Bacteroidaceae bacterium]